MTPIPRVVALPVYRALTGLGSVAGHAARAWRRVARDPRERDLAERLALPVTLDGAPGRALWLHAASVGEVRALAPLARALAREAAPHPILVTTSSTTGRERVRADLDLPARLAPWDAPGPLGRFLDALAPRLHVAIETELWPRRLDALARRGIPAALVSARISEARLGAYRRLAALYRPAVSSLALVAPASEEDAARLRELGARPDALGPVGNLKWDAAPDPPAAAETERVREELGLSPAVRWIVHGSAHPGEAGPLARALGPALADGPGGLVVAPRHPRAFDAVAHELREAGHAVHRASLGPAPAGARVVLVDRLGLLPRLYPLATCAIVGGTFVPVGGHSPLEAAAASVPMVAGPWIAAQEDLVGPLAETGALRRAHDADEAAAVVGAWLADDGDARDAGTAGRKLLAARRGLTSRLVPRLLELLR